MVSIPGLPDPLRDDAGRPVDAAGWPARRAQLLAAFRALVYGRRPPEPQRLRAWETLRDERACGGLATRIEIAVQPDGLDPLTVCCWLPNGRRPALAFLGLNFIGNHACHPDPAITPPMNWVPDRDGVVGNRAGTPERGMLARRWPVEMLLARGHALATAYSGHWAEDRSECLAAPLLAPLQGTPRAPDAPGAIAAWAWTLSRALDGLHTLGAFADVPVCVAGHSRLGKAALWAAAEDPRFALAVSNDSGCGGAGIARVRSPGAERIGDITGRFPHWFCPAYAGFAGREDALPIDQHQLLALLAPRPVHIASAADDAWADPRAEFLACVHADPVHRLLGGGGLGVTSEPPLNVRVGFSIGYHRRPGEHDVTPLDWHHAVATAERALLGR